MRVDSRALGATLVGAAIGGLAGYFFFTEHGRRVRRSLEPALDELSHEMAAFRGTLQRAVGVAHEGWQLLTDTLADTGADSRRFAAPRQTSPF